MAGLSIAESRALKITFVFSVILWIVTALVYWPKDYNTGENGAQLMIFVPLLVLSVMTMITVATALLATLFFWHRSKSNIKGDTK